MLMRPVRLLSRWLDNLKSALTHGRRPPAAAPKSLFENALEDAELLLTYAAETGRRVPHNTRDHVLLARTPPPTEKLTADLLAALTCLAKRCWPVTVDSLRACTDKKRAEIHAYWWSSILLVVLIVPFSVASFVASALSDAIRQDIKDANPLAVRIVGAVHPTSSDATSALPLAQGALPPGVSAAEVITELQQFAALIRSVDGRARRLNYFVLRSEADPFAHLRDPRD